MERARPIHSWWLFAAGVLLIGILSLRTTPVGGEFLDLKIYRETTDRMRAGESYYPAMTDAMTTFDAGPADSVRAYRLPTVFWLWRYCCQSWPATFLLIVAIGVLVGAASVPMVGLGTVVWLAAGLHGTGLEAWPFLELWAVPFCIAAILAIRRDKWVWAAVFALCGSLIREQAVLVLLGGLVAAWRCRGVLWPWLVSITAWAGFFAWHVGQVRPYLAAVGKEQPLVVGGGLAAVDGFVADLDVLEDEPAQIHVQADHLVEQRGLRQQADDVGAPDDQRQQQRAHRGTGRGQGCGRKMKMRARQGRQQPAQQPAALGSGVGMGFDILPRYRGPIGLVPGRFVRPVRRDRGAVDDRGCLGLFLPRHRLPFVGGVGFGRRRTRGRHGGYGGDGVDRILRPRQPDLLAPGTADGTARRAQGLKPDCVGCCTMGANDAHGAQIPRMKALEMLQGDR